MKKMMSLIKACMTSDMNLFKIKKKKNSKKASLLPLFIGGYLMFMIWMYANTLFEKMSPSHMQYILLSIIAFGISLMTIVEGVYKSGPLIFNCKDDDLLLSLPIKRRTVLFIRILKFYIFELLFNSMFLLPVMIAYIRWGESLTWTYYLVSIIMLLFLPIIPIVISCIIGVITSSISSRFKHKNVFQIVISMLFILLIMYFSYNMDNAFDYLMKHASSINEIITKIYYPAGIYAKLVIDFNILDLLIFIIIHIVIFTISVIVLSKFYFKINTRLKSVITTEKKTTNKELVFESKSQTKSLIKKELNTFFQTPVFIINSGFALVLFLITVTMIVLKFDSLLVAITDTEEGLGISKDLIMNNLSVFIVLIISITAYMTSITNSVISLEGRKINILKSLPIKVKTILMSKIYACLLITTPVLLLGNIILFIKFKISIIESILLLILTILIPLVSHFIGILVNLKYPKLDAENSTEVVKQSTSSFMAVMIGMLLAVISYAIFTNVIGHINAKLLLLITTVVYLIIDTILYLRLITKGVKRFNELSI